MTNRVRAYEVEDQDALVCIWYDAWHAIAPGLSHPDPKTAWRERWVREIVPNCEIAVAVHESSPVGFAALLVDKQELSQLFVAPSSQQLGVGSQLMRWCQTRSPQGLNLSTLNLNESAQTFYQRHGFRRAGSGINAINKLPTVVYAWPGAKHRSDADA